MNWIRNNIAFVGLAVVGLLMVIAVQKSGSQSAPTPFQTATQDDFRALSDLRNQNLLEPNLLDNVLEQEQQEPAEAVQGQYASAAMPSEELSIPPVNDLTTSVDSSFTITTNQLDVPSNDFARVAQLDTSVNIPARDMVGTNELVSNHEFEKPSSLDLPGLGQPPADLANLSIADQPVNNQPFADQATAATVEQTAMSSVAAASTMNTEQVTNVGALVEPAVEKPDSIKLRRGWQANPFINDDIKTDPNKDLNFFKSSGTSAGQNSDGNEQGEPAKAPAIVTTEGKSVFTQETGAAAISPGVPAPMQITGVSEAAAQRAVHHIEYGKSLARRSASFAARQEFFSALGVLAQSNDSQNGTNKYTTALRNAVTAFEEAEEFFVTDTESQIGIEVDAIVESHRTRIIGQTEGRHMTASQALQRYMAYAGQQLELAGGQNAAAAEALYSLGKLHGVLSNESLNPNSMDNAKSMVYHRAALGADSSNYRSANELGVLLARSGKIDEAKWMLKQSLMVYQMPQTWANLAKLHQRSGEPQLAQLALNERQIAMNTPSSMNPTKKITWLNREEFIQASPPDAEENSAVVQASASETLPTANQEQTEGEERKTIADRIKGWAPAIIKR